MSKVEKSGSSSTDQHRNAKGEGERAQNRAVPQKSVRSTDNDSKDHVAYGRDRLAQGDTLEIDERGRRTYKKN